MAFTSIFGTLDTAPTSFVNEDGVSVDGVPISTNLPDTYIVNANINAISGDTFTLTGDFGVFDSGIFPGDDSGLSVVSASGGLDAVTLTDNGNGDFSVSYDLTFFGSMIPTDGTVLFVDTIFVFDANANPPGGTGDDDEQDFIVVNFFLCFAAGTRIAGPDGDEAVEDLQIGDVISSADGRLVPVKWIGRQTAHKLFSGPHMQPVCIRAGALGNGLPHSDLTVTADHGMVIDGLVINASALINGTTIDWVPIADLPERVTYYHVETEAHDVILANGAPAETFVDYVGRENFDNYQDYLDLYGAEPLIPEMPMPRISSRRQLPADLRARFGIAAFSDDATDEALAFIASRSVA